MTNRHVEYELVYEKYSGIKIPVKTINVTADGVTGVYVLENSTVKFKQAMWQLGISEAEKEHVIMVGDRKFDAEGAAACGFALAGVRYGYAPTGELESYPHVCLADTVTALQAFLTTSQNL